LTDHRVHYTLYHHKKDWTKACIWTQYEAKEIIGFICGLFRHKNTTKLYAYGLKMEQRLGFIFHN